MRNQLAEEHSTSVDILKPLLRGRDIRRYRAEWADLWLIFTPPSLNLDIDEFPAVKQHLLGYGKERLAQTGRLLPDGRRARKRTPHRWYELQDTCAYHEHFSRPKLIWMDMSPWGRFAYSNREIFCNNTAYIMTGAQLKAICGILNSSLVNYFIEHTARTTGMGLIRWEKFVVESVPIPMISEDVQESLTGLLDVILEKRNLDPAAGTSEQESEIERIIYGLYDLTSDEIAAVVSHKGTKGEPARVIL